MDDSRDHQAEGTPDEETETWRRDLGSGHPLSPDSRNAESGPTSSDDDEPELLNRTEPEREPAAAESESRFDRRQVLFGGVVGAAVASLGWGGVLAGVGTLVGGDGGPTAVAGEYVRALADNDWTAAGALFHERSRFGTTGQDYESFLEENGRLDGFKQITPSVEDSYVRYRVTDVENATDGENALSLGGDIDPGTVGEWTQVTVVAAVDAASLGGPENTFEFLDGTARAEINVSLVEDSGTWYISRAFGVSPLI